MPKNVSFEQLQRTLKSFGFEPRREKGQHVVFRHADKGAIITIPDRDTPVRPIFVVTAARQVENSGIATRLAFEQRLERAGKILPQNSLAELGDQRGD